MTDDDQMGEALDQPVRALPSDEPPGADFEGTVDEWCARQRTNDLGNARRFVKRHGENLIFVPGIGWLAWDGKRWTSEEGDFIAQECAQATVDAIHREATLLDDELRRRQLHRFGFESGSKGKIEALRALAIPMVRRRVEQLDRHSNLLTIANGTLELGCSPVLREWRRADLMTRYAPVRFDPAATAPRFEDFVRKILPDAEVRAFVERWFGYSLTGDTSEQLISLWYGEGSNGKSTLLWLIGKILGDLHAGLPIASVLADNRRRGSEATPDLARLPGARMVTASEPDPGARFSESVLKSVTSGEPLIVRNLNRDFFEYEPAFKLTISFNSRPNIRGQDHGTWRRLALVPFEQTIGRDDVAPVRAAVWNEEVDCSGVEAPGVLAWLVRGAAEWYARGLDVPAKVRDATVAYREDTDVVGRFLADWCYVSEDADGKTIAARRLFDAFKHWCGRYDEDAISQTMFGKKLTDRGHQKRKSGIYYYDRICLTPEAEGVMASAGADGLEQLDGSEAAEAAPPAGPGGSA